MERRNFLRHLIATGSFWTVLERGLTATPAPQASLIRFAGEGRAIEAYRALPVGHPRAGVLVVAEESGLSSFVELTVAQLATAGYAALAPDPYARLGGTAAVGADPTAASAKINDTQLLRDLDLGYAYLEKLVGPQSKLGILGFGWGAGKALTYASENPDIAAVAVFYGANLDPLDRVLNLDAPVLGNYAGQEVAAIAKVSELEAALKKAGKSYDFKVYPDVKAGFVNPARTDRYNLTAAQDAWERTLQFFKRELNG
ncbi:dienelactone hydrolase family protein [Gloeobacter kilaueensis]|uniref:Carboxymethylenebutenolidase n=1 Tax=Gloeobacter kilaueensis (strain ATCC BAA-2537 / CCAP 1431/1 / ULC 316 / JS1) TaxID=1183438 RepID=U5QFU7_GLOK1|nr:dienelactone hydrolase family protein [Gloeobacter kilaueensis]AGY56494.1 carboxymethylenebutenolidase [Gloeobacter kilaueensis JS1]